MSARLKDIDFGATFGAPKKKKRGPDLGSRATVVRMRQRERVRHEDLRPITNATTTGLYDGADLRTHVRPGSLDAYGLPSIVSGRRVYPKRAPHAGSTP